MQRVVKQVCGIDVSQNELVVSLGRLFEDFTLELYANRSFQNSEKGFLSLGTWVQKLTVSTAPIRFVMEATGVYHEKLAYFLHDDGRELTVVLPNKISNYFRTLDVKTVTDKTAAEAITRFGLERKLDSWVPPSTACKRLRQLTRERDQLVQMRTIAKNQLHAEQSEAMPNSGSIKRIKAQIALFDEQELEIKAELVATVKQHREIKKKVDLMTSLPGIGILTAITILAETNDFNLIRNKRQLTSYAGLDIREKQSGTSVKGKPKISKKGNRYLRKAMHMPALAAIRSDERFKAIFSRLVQRHGVKMKAAVAIQRKLLEMAYIIYKTELPYDQAFLQKSREQQLVAP